MSQHEPMHQQPYSFGRDRYRGDAQDHSDRQAHLGPHGVHQSGSGMVHPQAQPAGSEMIPPPPAGHRGLFVLVVLYLVAGFMVLWTGASVAGTIEAVGDEDGTQVMIGMFMTLASLGITAGLGSWLIRIHRRRASYRRILDHHYAQRFGHHPDAM